MDNRNPSDPLSLLVNAADSRDGRSGGQQQQNNNASGGGVTADSLRRTLQGDAGSGLSGLSIEEQLLLSAQLQGQSSASSDLLSRLRNEQAILSQLQGAGGGLSHQNQLASLLGLGGGGGGGGSSAANDLQAALAAAQIRQQQQQSQPQLTHADLLALSRSGALGAGGIAGAVGGMNLTSDIDSLQWLEELERRQRLYGAAGAAGNAAGLPGSPAAAGLGAAPPAAPQVSASMAPSAAAGRAIDSSDRSQPKLTPAESASSAAAAAAANDHRLKSRVSAAAAASQSKAMAPSEPARAEPEPAAAEENKEELEKAPGSVIVPCRARGMPMDHNFKTAYFVIPENVKHGEELICSYFACRNAGIKFRYCSHCKVPVAKRNFRKRHKHGGEDVAGDDSDGEDEAVPPAAHASAKKHGIPSQITANRKDNYDGKASESTDSDQKEKGDAEKGLVRSTVSSFENKKIAARASAAAPGIAFKEGSKISFDRQKRWMELLEKRPSTKDGDSMSTWLMEVLAVSDLDTPLKPADDSAIVSDSDKARARSATQVVKKMKARAANDPESPHSETGYGSSNDDSNNNGSGKKKKAKEEGKSSPSAAGAAVAEAAGVVKKKRPAEDAAGASKDDEDKSNQPAEFFVSGSFAAWKERKKQKKQAKMSGSSGGKSGGGDAA